MRSEISRKKNTRTNNNKQTKQQPENTCTNQVLGLLIKQSSLITSDSIKVLADLEIGLEIGTVINEFA